jgi:hypothetical protein
MIEPWTIRRSSGEAGLPASARTRSLTVAARKGCCLARAAAARSGSADDGESYLRNVYGLLIVFFRFTPHAWSNVTGEAGKGWKE